MNFKVILINLFFFQIGENMASKYSLEELVYIHKPEGAGDIHIDYTINQTDKLVKMWDDYGRDEESIRQDLRKLYQTSRIISTLENQLYINKQLLTYCSSNITEQDVLSSQEALLHSVAVLDLHINISIENNLSTFDRLSISTENIKDVIKNQIISLKKLTYEIHGKVSNIANKFKGLLTLSVVKITKNIEWLKSKVKGNSIPINDEIVNELISNLGDNARYLESFNTNNTSIFDNLLKSLQTSQNKLENIFNILISLNYKEHRDFIGYIKDKHPALIKDDAKLRAEMDKANVYHEFDSDIIILCTYICNRTIVVLGLNPTGNISVYKNDDTSSINSSKLSNILGRNIDLDKISKYINWLYRTEPIYDKAISKLEYYIDDIKSRGEKMIKIAKDDSDINKINKVVTEILEYMTVTVNSTRNEVKHIIYGLETFLKTLQRHVSK